MDNQIPMSEALLQLAYDGPALRDGSMDVRDLAPALLSLGQLCERANEIINDGSAEITVNVRSDFQTGSFEMFIDIKQSLFEIAKTVFANKDAVTTAKELAELVGLSVKGTGRTASSLIGLIKFLRGNMPVKVEPAAPGQVSITINAPNNSGNVNLIVHPDVLKLLNDNEIRQNALGVMKPLEREGIDSFQVRDGNEIAEVVTKDDLQSFKELLEPGGDELLTNSSGLAALKIIKPSFDNTLKWVFSNGENRFSASIHDEEFLKRVPNLSFSKGDILIVELESESYRTSDGLRTEHKIRKVIEIKKPPPAIAAADFA